MSKKEVKVVGISYISTQSQSYQLLLTNEEANKNVPIVIGAFEAQSIAIQLEDIVTPRPLTHDLFSNIFEEYDIEMKEVFIYNLVEGIFYSKLIFSNGVEIECRTSDGISIALREDVPIYIEEKILDDIGFESERVEGNINNKNKSKENLESELKKAIENEDYERALEIKNKLKK